MNVLLAEANVPYTAAPGDGGDQPGVQPDGRRARDRGERRHEPGRPRQRPRSPIYGMPILDVDHAAAAVVVLKRGMSPGFAGIDNALYLDPKTADALRRREGLGGCGSPAAVKAL